MINAEFAHYFPEYGQDEDVTEVDNSFVLSLTVLLTTYIEENVTKP